MVNLNVNIDVSAKQYSINISNDGISCLNENIFKVVGDKKFVVIISAKVYKLYAKYLKFPKDNIYVLKDGEQEKNFRTLEKILNFIQKKKLTRQDYVISIGGGVCGDIAGFAASVYMRGIHLIQIPTTLLACVDSSVGGKTGVDTAYGKNLIGTFYQPEVVFIYTDFLKTLDERQFKTGLGEVVKYAFIEKSCKCDEDFNLINFLSLNYQKILSRDNSVLEELIKICVLLKISVVQKDEKENGLRKILNFGHTYAHALEQVTAYKKYTHGEAVIKGIEFVFDYALKKSMIVESYKFIADDLIEKFCFKKIPDYDFKKIASVMRMDKKATSQNIVLILPVDYGVVREEIMSEVVC